MADGKDKTKSRRVYSVIWWISGIVLIAAIVIMLVLFLREDTTYIQEEDKTESIGYLYCEATDLEGAVFSSNRAKSVKHGIKIIYGNGGMDKLFYNFTAILGNEHEAESELTNMRIIYNKEISVGDTSSSFSRNGNEIGVSVYVEEGQLEPRLAKLFLLDEEAMANLEQYSETDLKKFYEDKGLNCRVD